MPRRPHAGPAISIAMAGAGAVIAQFVAGKAARDALFLSRFDITALPLMIMAGSVVSIGLAVGVSRAMGSFGPGRLVPYLFISSAGLLVAEWSVGMAAPRLMAVLFYLHMLGLGPALVSGFWSVLNEQLDPRTAKRRLGQVAGAATAGGLAGSFLAERAAAAWSLGALLPVLAVVNVICAGLVHLVASQTDSSVRRAAAIAAASDRPAAPRIEAVRSPYLRNIAALVLLTTVGGTLLDYVFKATAVQALGSGEHLVRFFALYYGLTSLLTFTSQLSLSRFVLDRLGLGAAAGLPSVSIAAGSLLSLLLPGLPSVTFSRGSEYVSRMSLFRSAYELLYTPVSAGHKRAAKPIIDIGVDRAGDLAGGAMTRLAVLLAPAAALHGVILGAAIAVSVAGVVVARRLTRGYVQSLERSLLSQAIRLDFSEIEDLTTRVTMVRTLGPGMAPAGQPPAPGATAGRPAAQEDPILDHVAALRSRDRERIVTVLRQDDPIDAALVPHAINLLAWDAVAADATFALKRVAEQSVGQLVDALLDPAQDFAIRRRVARVMSVCVSQRAVDGLLAAFGDRFEVRFRCGESLAAIVDRNPLVRIDRDRILEVVGREVSVSRSVWESHRLLDGVEVGETGFLMDEFIRNRAGQSLAHVFTLLSLAIAREPLQIAYRGLQVDDPFLRGTALEYLETVLPPAIREKLWPFLEDRRPAPRSRRSREEILADLVRSNESITLNLAELRMSFRHAVGDGLSSEAGGSQVPRARGVA
ncbi:MAG: hypothetical protein ACE148_02425 [Vicinamibacterales bacterium]